ncbi:alpha/beta hydrolase [Eubacterium sp. 1001713B170207_170306_E7]|uniref:alpha/beta fold hydrolase n=1 Tax=Eubacterium sp. 1001713B170207_170306_E7 TaxID=2787097 RepID=UPI00189AA91D|nr:alpha/beta hydrolase [Eubacterium sp. 1001713B170207_170306_E7]
MKKKAPIPDNFTEEYIAVGGIEEYTLHYTAPPELPVLLFVHGGPGSSEAYFAYVMEAIFSDLCTVVHYDQRGTGKTFMRNPGAAPDLENLKADLHETVEALKRQYHKEKLFILGHSWGTVLGALYALEHPENVAAYIGVGQLVDVVENEQAGYDALKRVVIRSGNSRDIQKLRRIGPYPERPFDEAMLRKMTKISALKQKYFPDTKGATVVGTVLKSPVFKPSDVLGMLQSNKINTALLISVANFSLYDYSLHYNVPVYLITGDRDLTTPADASRKYLDALTAPAKKEFLIKDAGHSPMLDDPQAFKAAMTAILKN